MYTVPSPDGLSFSFFILCCVFSETASCPLKVTSVSKHKQIQASLPERRALHGPGPVEDDSWLPLFLPALVPAQAFVTAPQRQRQPSLGLHRAHNHSLDGFPAKQAALNPNLVPKHIPEEVASSPVGGLSRVS